MARPRSSVPTPAEWQIILRLADMPDGCGTVREMIRALNDKRAYTSIMSLMNVMWEKGLLKRKRIGKAYEYRSTKPIEKLRGDMVADLIERVFDGDDELALQTIHLYLRGPRPKKKRTRKKSK